jgi:hypothetical protein
MKRLASFVLIVAIASVPPVFMRWYRAIDTSETRCGYLNLLEPDYSGELAGGVKISRAGSEVRLDFTGLTNWSKVCLTAMREDSFEFADRAEDPANRPGFHRRGRWGCNIPNRHDAVAVALIKADGGTYAHQLVIPGATWLDDSYGWDLPPGFRQCVPVHEAVARCAWVTWYGQRLCWLLFPTEPERPDHAD